MRKFLGQDAATQRLALQFSEDIDLVIDKGWLGIQKENDPEAATSPSQLKKRLKIVEEMTAKRIPLGPGRERVGA